MIIVGKIQAWNNLKEIQSEELSLKILWKLHIFFVVPTVVNMRKHP